MANGDKGAEDGVEDGGDPLGSGVSYLDDTSVYLPRTGDQHEPPATTTSVDIDVGDKPGPQIPLLERITDGFFALDDDWRFVYINERANELINPDDKDLIGESMWEQFPGVAYRKFGPKYRHAMEHQDPVKFEDYYPPLDRWFEVSAYPSDTGLSVFFRDATERHRLEVELQEVYGRVTDAFLALDAEGRVVHMNERAEELLMFPEEQLRGEIIWDQFPDAFARTFKPDWNQALETQETQEVERYYPHLDRWYEGRVYPSETGVSVYFRDITDEKRHERQLKESTEALTDLHDIATSYDPLNEKLTQMLERGCERFDTSSAFIADICVDEKGCEFTITHSYTEHEDEDAAACYEPGTTHPLSKTYCSTVLSEGEVMATTDAENEDWVSEAAYEKFGLETYIGGRVHANGSVRGTVAFCDEEKRRRPFNDAECAMIDTMCQWVGYEIDREESRHELETINAFNTLTREISHDVLDADSRKEIEQQVCSRVVGDSESDGFCTFAWIGAVEVRDEELTVTTASEENGYASEIELPISAEGPAATAVRTREPQIIHDLTTDEKVAPWVDKIVERGYKSGMAVPLAYDEAVYGVLALYSDEVGAFDDELGDIVAHLGALTAHAIHAREQERALHSKTLTELELENRELGIGAGVLDPDEQIEINIGQRVDLNDQGYVFAETEGVPPRTVKQTLEAFPTIPRAELVRPNEEIVDWDDPDQSCLWQIALGDAAVTKIVGKYGGELVIMKIAPDAVRLSVRFPPVTDIGAFVTEVKDAMPGTDVISKRIVERDRLTAAELESVFSEQLTKKQFSTLKTAHLAGFFQTPREKSATEIARRLGVSQPTFTEHLRAAERKVFDALFAERQHKESVRNTR